MRQRFAKFMYPLRLPFVLAVSSIAAITSMPADSSATVCPKACDVQYYYDAARTQPAGFCTGACYPGGAYCYGDITDYYKNSNCEPCCPYQPNRARR
jgi:hypothetical protein